MAKDSIKLVVFTMDTDQTVYEYGIPIEQVQEITRPNKITKLPGMPSFVEGIMNLRKSVIPVVDIKKRFDIGITTAKDTTRIIVVQVNGQKCGLIVDDILEIIPVAAEDMEQTPSFAGGVGSEYIIGIGKVDDRLIIALDMDKILTGSEENELEKIAN
ncbi:MAG: chemotaxis protein CheW [Veillonellales bacterium]